MDADSPPLVTLPVRVTAETDKAILASADGDHFAWLPLSQVQTIVRIQGEITSIRIPVWLAHNRGLA